MANLNFVEADYQWVTEQIVTISDKYSERRIVSYLEGDLYSQVDINNTDLHHSLGKLIAEITHAFSDFIVEETAPQEKACG